jgi:hypothetical protein
MSPFGDSRHVASCPRSIEAICRDHDQFFRVVHGENVVDGLDIAMVEKLLEQPDVSMAALVLVDATSDRPDGESGTA